METAYLTEKFVKFTIFGGYIEVETCEVREPYVKGLKVRDCLIDNLERESKTIGDGQKLFGDDGERLQSVVVTVERN